MQHKKLYEDCTSLLLYGETIENSKVCVRETYVDPLGCDLQICRSCWSYKTGEKRKNIRAYFGGRQVYNFSDYSPGCEFAVVGYWKRLLPVLWKYEISKGFEESYAVNGTLLELCRRESARNRKIMNKYYEIGLLLAKKKGRMDTIAERIYLYKFEENVSEHNIKVHMAERIQKDGEFGIFHDEISIVFNQKTVFSFYFNSDDVAGIFYDKGEYIPGKWEKIIERLMENL